MELYNYYVANTISAHEFLPRTVPQMTLRVQNVMNAGLPWIVAIHRAGTRNNQDYFTEQVVGFANIDDFVEPGSMYRYSFDLEIFVHVDYCKMGIGSCLLDRMLEMCDTSHFLRGGYDWINRDDYLKNGPSRVVKTINFTFPHDANDQGQPKQVDSIKKWLKSFGFRASGHLHQVGFKLGKTVDTSIFQRSTTEEIVADQRPDHPL
ncbi:hypothetical protein BU24DRAFT_427365 [Aaosphaeria arxii CBS 175.79]|uniref:N-acetyltransferase domain-containing protein n=1 Tax=Aaosphaeria arxii CBS 175.79 TaxID=1450172 RepID=A0A6A5XE51_9PLEO|nr:uncharacterized protein BU24DRAFT_427365 [Aaosphaeria arxii CBS 175.79]KAF2011151.1 hypothetical protein BU24DRAFT_427365 [Aaosphaeria arxii CBS 175.79]